MQEWTRFYHEPKWHGLEILHARFVDHRFARHSHDYFVVGYVQQGTQAYTYRKTRHVTPAGQIFLVNPAEAHTGEAATPDGYVYQTMYPRPELMEQVTRSATRQSALPFFKGAVVDDPRLARLLQSFHRAIAARASDLECETRLWEALTHLIIRHTDDRFTCRPVGRERVAVRRAREYIDENFADDIKLSRLVAIGGLSAFHLTRAFAKEIGVPPHAYLEMVRTRHARRLLDAGRRIVDVALAVGYADQSHLTHRFKRILGITPGQYARGRHHSLDA